ncbi:hypothetical protein ONZ43_g1117 [Nemania bipapillata]|uniref:Uncharacterized protein n=1 Tax=Nemania bipapillata TaxID=110536 RepID=A0ACC2J5J9_9PEZI|nr:hypothetical protein ONZ43_g1117 [Nemania bipapillata]
MQPTRFLLKGRSVWKGPHIVPATKRSPLSIYLRCQVDPISRRDYIFLTLLPLNSLPISRPGPGEKIKPIRTQARSATILPNFVGLKFQVYNGKIYNDVIITEDMVGHKLGEFSPYAHHPSQILLRVSSSLPSLRPHI